MNDYILESFEANLKKIKPLKKYMRLISTDYDNGSGIDEWKKTQNKMKLAKVDFGSLFPIMEVEKALQKIEEVFYSQHDLNDECFWFILHNNQVRTISKFSSQILDVSLRMVLVKFRTILTGDIPSWMDFENFLSHKHIKQKAVIMILMMGAILNDYRNKNKKKFSGVMKNILE